MRTLLRKRGLEVFRFIFEVIGGLWTIIEIMEKCLPDMLITQMAVGNMKVILYPALLCGVGKIIYIVRTELFPTYKFGEKQVKICCGDILKKKDGTIVIGVNEQLKTKRHEVEEHSIHAQFIKKYGTKDIGEIFDNHGAFPDAEKQKAFAGKVNGRSLIFLKMSDLEEDGIPTTTVTRLKDSVRELFENQASLKVVNGTVYCPLLGTGASGGSMERAEVIQLLAREFLRVQPCLKEDGTDRIKTLVIVIYKKDFVRLDWISLKEELDSMFSACPGCAGLEHT